MLNVNVRCKVTIEGKIMRITAEPDVCEFIREKALEKEST